ncbi:MAG: DUF4175 family protein [Myxococcales bacterium]
MPPPTQSTATRIVAGYVRSLRRRASTLYALRSLAAAGGAGALGFAALAGLSGPIITPAYAGGSLGSLAVLAIGVGVWMLRPLLGLRDLGSCRLIERIDAPLASRVRSALEMSHGAPEGASQALMTAHASSVREALANVPPARVLPLSTLRHPAAVAGTLALAASALALLGDGGLRAGAYALTHPARIRDDGVRVAPVLSATRARLIYPSYLALPPTEVEDVRKLEVPRGTTIEISVTPRLPSRDGVLQVGEASVRLRAVPDGELFARFVAREDAELRVRIHSDDVWYQDSRTRSLRAVADQAPQVRLLDPADGAIVEATARVPVRLAATDDHGLSSIELAVRLPDGQEQRRRVWSSVTGDGPRRALEDGTQIVPAELGAREGDVLLLWIEARDADAVAGPNLGLSRAVTLEVASDAQKLSMHIPRLRAALDGALDVLADRLEFPLPQAAGQARLRMQELHDVAGRWLDDLETLVKDATVDAERLPIDVDQLRGIVKRTRRELRRERAVYRSDDGPGERRVAVDARVVEEHEKDVLLLADTLAQTLVDEARALTDELAQLKEEIRDLLERFKNEDSPEAKRALLAEIAKAQRRLRQLAESLSQLSKRVPSEFINREAIPEGNARSSAEDLKSAIESGDMDAAERALQALSEQIDELAQHIDSGGARFREARFGERDRAIASARRQLDMLAEEQERLVERTRDVVRRATDRAQAQARPEGAMRGMQQLAERIEQTLDELGRDTAGSYESRMLERAGDRMRDARDALKTGDMAEASRMASRAQGSLDQAAASLEASARMGRRRDGQARQHAEDASRAADDLRNLQQQLAEITPGLGEHVTEGERRQLAGDAQPQRAARDAAESLERKLGEGSGKADPPLSPEGAESMREVEQAMRRAERALQEGDPQQAALEQQDAAERLRREEERLARKQERRGGGGQGQDPSRPAREGEGGDGPMNGEVEIPGAEEFSGPVARRRRLLDAMREPAPSGFEAAVQRYYEELLR